MPFFQSRKRFVQICLQKVTFFCVFLLLTGLLAGCAHKEEGDLFALDAGTVQGDTGTDAEKGTDAVVGAGDSQETPSGAEIGGSQGPTPGNEAGDGQAAPSGAEIGESQGPPAGAGESMDGTVVPADSPAVLWMVHVCGAVREPGVYELPEGSRMIDAVKAAGGFLPEAAQDAGNLAMVLEDGVRIQIPTQEEAREARDSGQMVMDFGLGEGTGAASAGAIATSAEAAAPAADARQTGENGPVSERQSDGSSGLVNLNTADAAALKTLPGIGDARAEAILEYRAAHGPFASIEEIMKVSGIKQAAFEKLKDKITV